MAAVTKRFIAKNGVDNNSALLVNVLDPINSQDAATKAYADTKAPIASPTFTGIVNAESVISTTISHSGLDMTQGTNIDQIKTLTASLTLISDWQDTGITATNLTTGTYVVQLFANDIGSGGANYNEYYSGVLSWYSGSTSTSSLLPTDEVVLHRAGQSGEGGLYLRTFRTNNGFLKLQIFSNTDNTSSANYIFKFRRLI